MKEKDSSAPQAAPGSKLDSLPILVFSSCWSLSRSLSMPPEYLTLWWGLQSEHVHLHYTEEETEA